MVRQRGVTFAVVLKHPQFDDGTVDNRTSLIMQETDTLHRLVDCLWAPRCLASDPFGTASGSPAILQSLVVGSPQMVPRSIPDWLRGLSLSTHEIAGSGIALDEVTDFAPWLPDSDETPRWCSSPARFNRSLEDFRNGVLPSASGPHRFVHRDLHPGNVLFENGCWVGIVDWAHGCRGVAEVDVSRCRVEIALLAGLEAANSYLRMCADLVPNYDFRWDVLVALELSPWVKDIVECFQSVGANVTESSVEATLDWFILKTNRSTWPVSAAKVTGSGV